MKKLFLLIAGIVIALGTANSTFAASSMLDYTYIDCVNGNDSAAEPFNSTKPYNSLNNGVQNSINYINNNWNISAQAQNVLGKRFVIKVKSGCVFDLQGAIQLNFTTWQQYKNDVIIMSDDDNKMFWFKWYFYGTFLSNLTFKNVDFMDQGAYSFYFQTNYIQWIKIINSIVRLKSGASLSYMATNYPGNIWLENSIIKITGNEGNNTFTTSGYINNSKIEFTTPVGKIGKLTINPYYENKMNLIASTLIDVAGNDFYSGVDMVNTKVANAKAATFAGYGQVFVNNSISSTSPVVSTGWRFAYNNVFLGGFTDTSDAQNIRRNYSSAQGNTGIGWFYRKGVGSYIDFAISDRSVYKDITGTDLPNADSAVYVVFQ